MQRPADPTDLSFLDGYLFRIMVQMLEAEGVDGSGLYNFYRARIEEACVALSHYDRILVRYVLGRFDPGRHRIVHAGTGLGTLPSALAYSGFTVSGIERDPSRVRAAAKVHSALAEAWPSVASRYRIVEGEFPAALAGTPWMGPHTLMILTNFVATWPSGLRAHIMRCMQACGHVILDARLFETIKDTPEERQGLIEEIEALGLIGTPLEESPPDAFYYHFIQRSSAP